MAVKLIVGGIYRKSDGNICLCTCVNMKLDPPEGTIQYHGRIPDRVTEASLNERKFELLYAPEYKASKSKKATVKRATSSDK